MRTERKKQNMDVVKAKQVSTTEEKQNQSEANSNKRGVSEKLTEHEPGFGMNSVAERSLDYRKECSWKGSARTAAPLPQLKKSHKHANT